MAGARDHIVRRLKEWGHWLIYEFPRNPGLEIYSRLQDMRNRANVARLKSLGPAAAQDRFSLYHDNPLPRIIWMYWDTGESGAPFVVRRCIESWRRHNPGWEIRVLDSQTVSNYADMADFPKIPLKPRFFANLLRLRLLRDHGGVWADATVYCHRPLDAWIPQHMGVGFFLLKNPGPSRNLASWFLIAGANHRLVTLWEKAYSDYLATLRRQPDKYFMFFYTLQWLIKRNPEAKAIWNENAFLPAKPSLMMMPAIAGQVPEEQFLSRLEAGLAVSKLSWKTKIDEAVFDAFCAGLPGEEIHQGGPRDHEPLRSQG